MIRGVRRAAFVALLLLPAMVPAMLEAQQRPPAGTPRRPAEPTRVPVQPARGAEADTLRGRGADSLRTGADSLRAVPLVDWTPDDSVITALLRRAGYSVVRYEAGRVGFNAATREMRLTGTDSARAAVLRDSTLLVADTIAFNDSTQMIAARGDTIVMREAGQRSDVIALNELTYNVESREGRAQDFNTIATSGEDWKVSAHRAGFASDSSGGQHTVYGVDGTITSCLDEEPHYHFRAKELKRVTNSVIVARPAILYIQGVPVMWLPFIFQDIRTGRRSGILTPRLGFSELVRNSPTYRRTAENLGYYFALTDYIDAQVSVDWRSAARATEADPGWTRLNAEMRYRWLDRFMGGTIAVSRNTLSTGSTNLALSWSHNQEFSSRTRFTTNLNYVSSTQVQRQTIINPMAAVATIASQANFVRRQGPFQVNIGGSRRQYPGRDQVDQDFPSINIASQPLTVGEWFVLNPSFAFASRQSLNLDASGDFAYRYSAGAAGLDSVRLTRNTRATSVSLGTPFKIFDFQVQSGFRFNETENDFPEVRVLVDPADSSRRIQRVYQKTFLSTADFDISIGLPQFLQGTFNFAPNVSASNVDPGVGFLVRSERTSGEWVAQSKRLSYGAGVSPTVYRLFGGIGPVERMRHGITPTLSWSYSPQASVSDEFLAAIGSTRQGYLGALAQNRLSLGLSTNIEAKMRAASDTSDAEGEKIRLLSLQFTSLTYDFERKRATGRSGFATDRFGYTLRSDLLPGFDVGVDYSLFQGSVLSDTAVFSPYRDAVRATFSLSQNSALIRGIGRLLGFAPPTGRVQDIADDDMGSGGLVSSRDGTQQGLGGVTGTRSRGAVQEIQTGQGFRASFTVSSQRQRPPSGDGRVIEFDPSIQCAAFVGLPQYEPCLRNAQLNPQTGNGPNETTAGGSFRRVPPTTSVGIRTSFNLTPKWAAGWNTTYDVVRSEFASQMVTLQRELHDWRAIFGFTQAPNGNFAFTFFISLKAQPEIKLDYDRQTYRQPASQLTP